MEAVTHASSLERTQYIRLADMYAHLLVGRGNWFRRRGYFLQQRLYTEQLTLLDLQSRLNGYCLWLPLARFVTLREFVLHSRGHITSASVINTIVIAIPPPLFCVSLHFNERMQKYQMTQCFICILFPFGTYTKLSVKGRYSKKLQ